MAAMARAGTIAGLLPGANYTLRETARPPIELFRRYGVPMALATNSNPSSSPTNSPPMIMNLACTLFRVLPEDALAGFTVNGARALASRPVMAAWRWARSRISLSGTSCTPPI